MVSGKSSLRDRSRIGLESALQDVQGSARAPIDGRQNFSGVSDAELERKVIENCPDFANEWTKDDIENKLKVYNTLLQKCQWDKPVGLHEAPKKDKCQKMICGLCAQLERVERRNRQRKNVGLKPRLHALIPMV